jgi:hypothetical protein
LLTFLKLRIHLSSKFLRIIVFTMSSNDLPNPGHPEGARGKDTGTFTQLGNELLSDEYASRVASSLARSNNKRVNLHDRDAVEAENIARAEHNLNRANKRMDDNHIEDVVAGVHGGGGRSARVFGRVWSGSCW